jgi:fatty acyl-CoA reductase
MSFSVKQFYSNKTILISGCTGFLAKMILEKIIRTCSDFKKIFVLIRNKQGVTLQDRLQKDIFNSLIFKVLFETRPELVQVVKERVIPV